MLKFTRLSWVACAMLSLVVMERASAQVVGRPPTPDLPFSLPRMVSPDIDEDGKPFSYPSAPTDQIGVMQARFGTEITPEGYLYTGYGELIFYLGLDRIPLRQRVRTLDEGYLPIVRYEQTHDGLIYRFTAFAASLGESQDGTRVANFLRVTVHNPGPGARRGFVTSAWRYQGDQTTPFSTGDNRFRRPVAEKSYGGYVQLGETFNPASKYTMRDNAFLRDNKVVYLFPTSPEPAIQRTYRGYYGRVAPIGNPLEDNKPISLLPTTPVAVAEYAVDVPAGGDKVLDFKMPVTPIDPEAPEFNLLKFSRFDERLAQVRLFWKNLLSEGMKIQTPEAKVNDTFKTSLVNDLLALNRSGADYIQTINQLHYHGFYLRDSSDFVRMYDTTGYQALGGKVLDFFATRQQEDGNFLSQPGQFDGWGYTLLTYGEHYRITHDKAFAASVYPRVVRAVEWLKKATAADPLHIMPATNVHDNEYIPGHLTGYNFLALDGLAAAELLAHDLGHTENEKNFRLVEQELRKNFLHQLDAVTLKNQGIIPPALDGDMSGADWGNLLSLTPEQQLSPTDPRVLKTLHIAQSHYQEGLMTYHEPTQGTFLHHYLTIKNGLTELIVGEQEQAIRELYAELVHTTSTHGGFEFSVRPWAERDFSGNLSPHGWFAAEYRNFLRNMMVREEGQTLHLLSAISPAWVGNGKEVVVEGAVTYFGRIGFRLSSPREGDALLQINEDFDAGYQPKQLALHLPWFMEVQQITVDGRPATPNQGIVLLPSTTKRVEWTWTSRPSTPDAPVSYDAAAR